ncbi:SH3 domain-containing protein [Actibacterium lipolyticum]|uniref:Bacterial SH3 domain protein n=1 Tax=Actibacterium lipolyticum TaxID=1524263 RepID=A0A238JMX8_9RHOB|nr:SH3 domain-containing protein [Actibacterium lipolyticum]SMX31845.1 Bacterial SH3 domain protein [Actibacterium lipolyticum]
MIELRAALFALACVSTPLCAQTLDVAIQVPQGDGQAANCALDVVAGLNPNGDGFLAVRTGPGTQYPQIGSLYNGDQVIVCDARGKWRGVFYGPNMGEGSGQRGWVHSNWLRPLAG